jgi:two-component system, NarL family, nitrate/nitrite response regulator NarL
LSVLQTASPAPRSEPIRIVIADEHPIFRDGLRRLLETRADLQIVGETGDGLKAAALIRDLVPDILLLGLGASGGAALDVVRTSAMCGSVGTILLTASVDTPEVANAFQLGARGVVPKDSAADALFGSIDSVMDGHYWIGDNRVSNVAGSLRKLTVARRRAKAFGLTRRELEIVRAIVDGYTNKQIAKRSSISESTVKRHVTHIFDKLGASNRIEVALFAAHHRLLDCI